MAVPVSALRTFPIVALCQQKGQGEGSGDSSTHSNKPPCREAVCVGTVSPLQQSHHHFLPPGFPTGKEDASPR